MADFDVDAAVARHRPVTGLAYAPNCELCGQPWPCDAAQALDMIRERDEEIRRLRSWIDDVAAPYAERQAASVRPDRPQIGDHDYGLNDPPDPDPQYVSDEWMERLRNTRAVENEGFEWSWDD